MNSPLDTLDTRALRLDPLFDSSHAAIATSLEETCTQYWLLPDEAPVEEYRRLYHAIVELEARLDGTTITETLTRAATAFHRDTGHCPFCRERGPLHLALAAGQG